MEEIINLKHFNCNIKKIYELRNLLENKQIKRIDIKFKDEIKIKYDEKTIELDKEFNFKVKLIRNKYYRNLSNILNLNIPYSGKAFERFNGNRIDLGDYIKLENYKDMLKMALINFIGVYNFDNIFKLTKEEMMKLEEYKYGNNNNKSSRHIVELLGMYCHNQEGLFKILETKIDKSRLEKMKKCNTFILICPELIREFSSTYLEEFKECDIRDDKELENIILNKVLVHEIGHGVFDYTSDLYDDKSESRANYFASITFDGTFDKIIKKQTGIQGGIYKNPQLLTDDTATIRSIAEELYNIKENI